MDFDQANPNLYLLLFFVDTGYKLIKLVVGFGVTIDHQSVLTLERDNSATGTFKSTGNDGSIKIVQIDDVAAFAGFFIDALTIANQESVFSNYPIRKTDCTSNQGHRIFDGDVSDVDCYTSF